MITISCAESTVPAKSLDSGRLLRCFTNLYPALHFVLKSAFFTFAFVVAFSINTAYAQIPLSAQTSTVSWKCQAFYLPARSIWKRTLAIEYDAEGIRTVAIDGVAVYSFSVIDSSILTAMDGERIQFNAAALTWTSDLRGVVSSQGLCER